VGEPLRVGIVGAGKISAQYSETFARLPQVAVTAVADLDAGRAQALAGQHPGARATDLAGLLAAPDVDVVLDLTIPAAHAEVTLAALAAGKHVYGEKPLTATSAEAREVVAAVAAARDRGLRVACAPDTVLGTGTQTARAAVDAGLVGVPHAATAFMVNPGHERWHPDPEFYYRPGGGPLLDMGPYYLTALVHLLGPVSRVLGAASRPRATRTVGSGPKQGQEFAVEVASHVTGVLEHESGALTTLVMSFDVWGSRLPRIEVHGDAGSLSVPDPNYFEGPVELLTRDAPEWAALEPGAGYVEGGRGIGVADLALALRDGVPHRADLDVAVHVLDVMEQLLAAAEGSGVADVASTCERPDPVAGAVDLARLG